MIRLMAIRHHIPARMRVWAGTLQSFLERLNLRGWLGRDLGQRKSITWKDAAGRGGHADASRWSDAPRPSEPIVMVPRADLYGGRVLLTGAAMPGGGCYSPCRAGEFDRATTIGMEELLQRLAGKSHRNSRKHGFHSSPTRLGPSAMAAFFVGNGGLTWDGGELE